MVKFFSWYQLGIPEDLCWCFVNIDDTNKVVVRTQYAAKHLDMSSSYSPLHFSAVRGVGQGDPIASPCWIAFFDILNRSLELISAQEPLYYRASGYTLKKASDLDYIDDLIPIARSHPSPTKSRFGLRIRDCVRSHFRSSQVAPVWVCVRLRRVSY